MNQPVGWKRKMSNGEHRSHLESSVCEQVSDRSKHTVLLVRFNLAMLVVPYSAAFFQLNDACRPGSPPFGPRSSSKHLYTHI